ncbi:tetratricopeptide repeat protein [Mucilaginibacter daejeonensis]|uniref:tetratricopeptide repeat protein n=1 Tax=Mucilaginibacter daejeonensis TaxID=398049 RepID=UPI001D178091|nr:tetratricopeptide repeat protein [Mucilaginibacter daejeonensis]UEG52119.1 tetratricopeptide repeat protein [Mucilaginibacter daejeonensis]
MNPANPKDPQPSMIKVETSIDHIFCINKRANLRPTNINLPTFIYYQFAHNYLNNQQFDQARQITDQLIKIRPNSDEPYALMADILIKQGKKKGAIEQLKLASSRSTDDKYLKRIESLSQQ